MLLWLHAAITPSQPDVKAVSHDTRSPTPGREADRLQSGSTSMPARRLRAAPRCLLCLWHLLLSRVINDRGDEVFLKLLKMSGLIFKSLCVKFKDISAVCDGLSLWIESTVSSWVFGDVSEKVIYSGSHWCGSCKNKWYFCHFEEGEIVLIF